jgi:hypothetical protein
MADEHPPPSIVVELREQGYSKDTIKEIWKWYDASEKKGVASF